MIPESFRNDNVLDICKIDCLATAELITMFEHASLIVFKALPLVVARLGGYLVQDRNT